MAIDSPTLAQHASAAQPADTGDDGGDGSGIDIDAWTVAALQSLRVSPAARGTGRPLSIPIDESVRRKSSTARPGARGDGGAESGTTVKFVACDGDSVTPPRRSPSRRDSMARRDALLKGKEGSRQRRRWENNHLIGVPNAQPPEPIDWQIHATHPVHNSLPYQLAQRWDHGLRDRVQDETRRLQAVHKKKQLLRGGATGLGVGEVPRDLRETAKRSPVIRSWVRALEEPVRQFLHDQHVYAAQSPTREKGESKKNGGHRARSDDGGNLSDSDDDDDEIVFAGRADAMRTLREKKLARWRVVAHGENVSDEAAGDFGVVFDSFGNDESASFKRWLAHSVSDYYGLVSTSVMVTSSQKIVHVGLKRAQRMTPDPFKMPRPLWELC